MNDLLASAVLLGGSSVALTLTALAARRARIDRRRAAFACRSAMHYHTSAKLDAERSAKMACDAQVYAEWSMKAANAASLDRLFAPAGVTVTRPETADVIPTPVPKPKLHEVDDVPGSVVAVDDAGDVIEFGQFWRDVGGGEGGGDAA